MDKGTKKVGIFMVLPLIFVFILLTVFPFIYMIVISFMHYNLAEWKAPYFVGLENYIKVFKDEGVHSTLEFTFLLVIFALPLEIILGGFIALFIQNLIGEKLIRSSLLLPMMIPAVVVGVIWKMLFNYEYGPVNFLLSLFKVNKIAWFGDPFFARIAVVIMDIWQWTPFIFLVLYSGLQTVPTDLIEAAKVDGGNRWIVFKYIEFPFLRPLLWILIILRLIDILRMFDIVYMTSFGGPGYTTHTLSFYIYKVGVSFGWDVGYASALSILLLILVTLLTNILIKTMKLWEYLEL